MNDVVRQVAQAVLYEGYLLWPYRRSALKNQHRWTIGGVYPRPSAGAYDAGPHLAQTQCLLTEAAPGATVDVRVRFLHVVARDVSRLREASRPGVPCPAGVARPGGVPWPGGVSWPDGGRLEPVPELVVGGRRHLSWEEATEREVVVRGLRLAELARSQRGVPVHIPAGRHVEWLYPSGDGPEHQPGGGSGAGPGAGGARGPAGAVVRHWRELRGRIDISAEPLELEPVNPAPMNREPESPGPVEPRAYRLTVRILNTTAWYGHDRAGALRRTFVSAHTVVHAEKARLVSLTDPPAELAALAAGCDNVGTWPVLVGAEGQRNIMLSAPVILPDYPQVAPESPGDLFDATEIDQLLTLNILTLGDDERREMRDSDPRAREILDRCAALTPEQLMGLHGRLRELQPSVPSTREGPA